MSLASGGIGSYLGWGHARGATALIGVGAAGAGVLLAVTLIFGALWATAPTRQRNEAWAVLAAAESDAELDHWDFEVGRLWSFLDRKSPDERILLLDLRFTNRRADQRVNLNPELIWQNTFGGELIGSPQGFLRRFDKIWERQLRPPLDIGPQQTVDGSLAFRSTADPWLRFGDVGEVFLLQGTLFLRLEDHVSGEFRDVPLDVAQWDQDEETSS